MRYVFIYNPVAGKNGSTKQMTEQIRAYCAENGLEAAFYSTEYSGHARVIAENEASVGDEVRIYAVGGDGTLSEVACGAMGYENAAVGVFPCGSGNDFVRTFAPKDTSVFFDIQKQMNASPRLLDGIHASDRDALNVCSLGLDAQVAYHMDKFKKIPFVSGSMAYNLSLVACLMGKIGCDLEVTIDDGVVHTGQYLFALAASGCWYGGGWNCAPEADPSDGKLDFVLIRNPGLLKLLPLVNSYKSGRYLNDPRFKDLVTFVRGDSMKVKAKRLAHCNFDGECKTVQEISFSIYPGAVRFIDPTGEKV